MNTEDLKVLAEMGRALWVDPRESQLATVETLSAITLLDLTPERAIERAAAALLKRVTNKGFAANTRSNLKAGLGMGQPFFRLYPEERFLLVALHLGRWSYARLSRVFGESIESLEIMAWSSRVQLASSEKVVAYPAGASLSGPHCPEYDPKRPWTQRFMDEEIHVGRERVFLQNHLMVCESCRDTLARCREVYYAIDRLLPRLGHGAGDAQLLKNLEKISRHGIGMKTPTERSFVESLEVFGRRTDVKWVLAMFAALLVWKLFEK